VAALSQRAYAAHRGVSHTAVQKAIQSGRISTLPDGRIDPAVADQAWDRNTLYPVSVASQYGQARTIHETYRARLAKLDYEERVGQLVPAAQVRETAFNTYRRFRDAMLNIPNRIAAALAAEGDAGIVHEILAGAIRDALGDFADGATAGLVQQTSPVDRDRKEPQSQGETL
jgi:hypothetical protein